MFPPVSPILPPISTSKPVDVSGSGSAEPSSSGEIPEESSTSGSSTSESSGDSSGSGQVLFSGRPDVFSGGESTSGGPQEAEGGSAVLVSSGEGGSQSGSGEGFDGQHSGFKASGSGFTSGSGDISGSSGDSMIIMVDGIMKEVWPTPPRPTEQEWGQGGIDSSGVNLEASASGSGSMSGSGSGGISGISFVDQGGFDLTVQPSGEQEVSGYRPSGSGFHSGFPSGVSSSGSGSEDSIQHRGDVIYLTDDNNMMEVTEAPQTRHPEHGRGVVEISGQGSGSGSHHEFSGTFDINMHHSGSGVPHELSSQTTTYEETTRTDQSGHEEEDLERHAEPTVYAVTPDAAYTSPTTAPSVSYATPSVMEQPEVVEGMCL